MKTRQEIEAGLGGFWGTENYFRLHPSLVLTDGCFWLADAAQCFWLFDAINSHLPTVAKDRRASEISFWKLSVSNNKGKLVCERDTDDVLLTQDIEYTDFPLPEIKFFVQKTVDMKGRNFWVAMLPSEY